MRVSPKARMTSFEAVEVCELHVERCAERCRANGAVEAGMALRNRLSCLMMSRGRPTRKPRGFTASSTVGTFTVPMSRVVRRRNSSGPFPPQIIPVVSHVPAAKTFVLQERFWKATAFGVRLNKYAFGNSSGNNQEMLS